MTDKEKFKILFDKLNIEYEVSTNSSDIIINSRDEIDDWDLEEWAMIVIEFDDNDKYLQFKLTKGMV